MNKKMITALSLSAFLFAACGSDDSSSANDNEKSSSSVAVGECDEDDCDEEPDDESSSSVKEVNSSSSSAKEVKSSSSSAEGPSVVSKSEVKDSRDGKVYKTVKIGAQTWMAENLAYKTADSKCSSDDSDCKNGRLYHWADVMDLGIAANTSSAALVIKSKHRGICPEGFHVPNKSDYERLFTQPWIDNVFRSYDERDDGWFGFIDYPTDAESLVFADDEECRLIITVNSSYNESDLKSCNLYKFNGSLQKDRETGVRYWTALESGDDKALGASLLNAKYVFDEAEYSAKSDLNYLRCVSDEDRCGGKELQDNQYCYNDKVYEKSKPSEGACDELAAKDSRLKDRCYGPKDSSGLVAYSPVKFYAEGGIFYPLCGGKKLAAEQFCAAGKAYDKCDGETYDVEKEFCSYGTIYSRVCGDRLLDDTQFCVEGVAYDKCGGEGYDVTKEKCVSNVVNRMCGTSYYPRDKQFCVEETVYDKCGGEEYDVTQDVCVDGKVNRPCGDILYIPGEDKRCIDGVVKVVIMGTLKDSRDGQIYKTVTIGAQTWMAENLNYRYVGVKYLYDEEENFHKSDSTSWCLRDEPSNCEKYGRLYTWSAVMDSAARFSENAGTKCGYKKECNPNIPHRGICPEGWHVPTNEEFDTLYTYIGGTSTAGKLLRSTTDWRGDQTIRGTDSYSFSVLPAGIWIRGNTGVEGGDAYLWTTSEDSTFARARSQHFSGYEDVSQGNGSKYSGRSLRCLKD